MSLKWDYLSTDNEEIISMVKDKECVEAAWPIKVHTFEKEHHVYLVFHDTISGDRLPIGVSARPGVGELPGEWRHADMNFTLRPCHDNVEVKKLFDEVTFRQPTLPGLPRIIKSFIPEENSFILQATSYFLTEDSVVAMVGQGADYDPAFWEPIETNDFFENIDTIDLMNIQANSYTMDRNGLKSRVCNRTRL